MDIDSNNFKFYGTFAASGVAARALQLGIMRKNFGYNKLGYVYSAGFFLGLGVFSRFVQYKSEELLSRKLETYEKLNPEPKSD